MSWRDREYNEPAWSEPERMPGGIPRPPPVTFGLLIVHAAAFALLVAAQSTADRHAPSALALSESGLSPLSILLHPLGGASVFSILFVVVVIWTFGVLLERRIGWRRFLLHYVVGNVAAGLVYWGLATLGPWLARGPLDEPLGGLAAWCIVTVRVLRHEHTGFFGRMVPLPRMLGIVAVIVILLDTLPYGPVGAAAWLGALAAGAGVGWLVETLHAVRGWQQTRAAPRGLRPLRRVRLKRERRPPAEEPEIDDILAKISREGFAALTEDERVRLEAARQAKLRRSSTT